jgi:hypothetical protein
MNEYNYKNDVDNSNDSGELYFSSSDEFGDNNSHSEHSFSILQFILNCSLHVTILFFFLYILFLILIAPIAQNGFKHEFDHVITELFDHAIPDPIDLSTMSDSEFDNYLSKINEYNSLDILSKTTIRLNIRQLYTSLKDKPYIIKNYLQQYSSTNHIIKQHNDIINDYGNAIILFLITLTISLCCSFKYFYPNDINLTKLFIENIITFIFIGMGEYWFFTTYATKFIPAPPSLLSKSAIDTIKSRFTLN